MNQQVKSTKRKETINEMLERRKKTECEYPLENSRTIGEMTEDELLEEMNKKWPKIDLCKLGDLMRHNAMGEIEEIINPSHLRPENHLSLALQVDDGGMDADEMFTLLRPTWPEKHLVTEWLVDGGGIEAIEKWRLFNKHEKYEKEKWPKAYEMKQSIIYWLDDVYEMVRQEGLSNPKEQQAQDTGSQAQTTGIVAHSDDKPPPKLESLNKLTEGNTPVLREWINGKYKCVSLEKFIKAYIKITDNLSPSLIRDYLISERTGKPYRDSAIEKGLSLHGPGRK